LNGRKNTAARGPVIWCEVRSSAFALTHEYGGFGCNRMMSREFSVGVRVPHVVVSFSRSRPSVGVQAAFASIRHLFESEGVPTAKVSRARCARSHHQSGIALSRKVAPARSLATRQDCDAIDRGRREESSLFVVDSTLRLTISSFVKEQGRIEASHPCHVPPVNRSGDPD